MAKTSGIPSTLLVGIYDLSGDIGALEAIETSVATINVTSIADLATSKITGRYDGRIAFSGFFNVTAGAAHAVLSVLPGTDEVVQWLGAGVTASLTAKRINYNPTFNEDGSVTIAVEALGNGSPVEWGVAL